jgi:hypothetical protein
MLAKHGLEESEAQGPEDGGGAHRPQLHVRPGRHWQVAANEVAFRGVIADVVRLVATAVEFEGRRDAIEVFRVRVPPHFEPRRVGGHVGGRRFRASPQRHVRRQVGTRLHCHAIGGAKSVARVYAVRAALQPEHAVAKRR